MAYNRSKFTFYLETHTHTSRIPHEQRVCVRIQKAEPFLLKKNKTSDLEARISWHNVDRLSITHTEITARIKSNLHLHNPHLI